MSVYTMLVFKAMLTFCILSLAPLTAAIWPIPTHYEHGDRTLTISKHVTFTYTSGDGGQALQKHYYDQPVQNYYYDATEQIWFGPETSHQEPENSGERILNGNDLVQYAIRSAYNSLFNHNIVPWKFHPRNWTEHSLESVPYISHVDLKLLQNDPDEIVKSLAGDVDESYTLILTEIGNATISANTSVGLVRGLTTFTQLFFQHSRAGSSMYSDHGPSDISHPTTYTTLAPVSIADTPAFQHRGLNLDVSRHFFPVTDIKRTISALAYNKMNRLHLHVTDSQSWPLDIPALPSLAKQGAFRPDLIYTADDFDDLQRHAALQGVQLITEIDMPGHTSSIYHSNPELIAAFDIQPEHYTYAAEPPSGTLKLNSSVVYDFLETVLDDLLPRIAPYTSYFHTGGDEVNR
jgi:hexosaminidase